MSYILEALKKSEQERGQGGSPGIQTIHSSSLSYRSNRKPLWPWLLFAILCVNLAMLVYFMLARSGGDVDLQPPVAAAPPPPRITPAAPRPQPALAQTPRAEPVVTPARAAPVVAPPTAYAAPVQTTTIEPPPPAAAPVVEVDELPPEISSHVPRMAFSAHVYSSNPKQRSVVINDMFLEEGELLSNDLKLSEITPDGVIFEFRGYRFHRSVLAGWE